VAASDLQERQLWDYSIWGERLFNASTYLTSSYKVSAAGDQNICKNVTSREAASLDQQIPRITDEKTKDQGLDQKIFA
jgi:hypothetical protein